MQVSELSVLQTSGSRASIYAGYWISFLQIPGIWFMS